MEVLESRTSMRSAGSADYYEDHDLDSVERFLQRSELVYAQELACTKHSLVYDERLEVWDEKLEVSERLVARALIRARTRAMERRLGKKGLVT